MLKLPKYLRCHLGLIACKAPWRISTIRHYCKAAAAEKAVKEAVEKAVEKAVEEDETSLDMYQDLRDKTILITGGATGIGEGVVRRLAPIGTKLIAIDVDDVALNKLCKFKNVQTVLGNVAEWGEIKTILCELGLEDGLDGIVNNAGMAIIKPFEEFIEEDIDAIFNVNFKGPFVVTQSLLPYLKCQASIVMVSSIASSKACFGHSVYGSSKSALNGLTQNLALELGQRNIRVNSVDPTVVWTQMGKKIWADPKKHVPLLNKIPLGRFCDLAEAVDAICFLLSARSSFINGHHLNLEGGSSA